MHLGIFLTVIIFKKIVLIFEFNFRTEAEYKIESLATITNCLSFFISDNGSNDELNDAFSGSLAYAGCLLQSEQHRILLEQKKFIKVGQMISGFVSVDSKLGQELTFHVYFEIARPIVHREIT